MFTRVETHTSMMKSQNHPVLPAVPRIGRMAAAKRLEKTRARFKLDLSGRQIRQILFGNIDIPEKGESDRQFTGLVEKGGVKDSAWDEALRFGQMPAADSPPEYSPSLAETDQSSSDVVFGLVLHECLQDSQLGAGLRGEERTWNRETAPHANLRGRGKSVSYQSQ
jgi:hypothetical protein